MEVRVFVAAFSLHCLRCPNRSPSGFSLRSRAPCHEVGDCGEGGKSWRGWGGLGRCRGWAAWGGGGDMGPRRHRDFTTWALSSCPRTLGDQVRAPGLAVGNPFWDNQPQEPRPNARPGLHQGDNRRDSPPPSWGLLRPCFSRAAAAGSEDSRGRGRWQVTLPHPGRVCSARTEENPPTPGRGTTCYLSLRF